MTQQDQNPNPNQTPNSSRNQPAKELSKKAMKGTKGGAVFAKFDGIAAAHSVDRTSIAPLPTPHGNPLEQRGSVSFEPTPSPVRPDNVQTPRTPRGG